LGGGVHSSHLDPRATHASVKAALIDCPREAIPIPLFTREVDLLATCYFRTGEHSKTSRYARSRFQTHDTLNATQISSSMQLNRIQNHSQLQGTSELPCCTRCWMLPRSTGSVGPGEGFLEVAARELRVLSPSVLTTPSSCLVLCFFERVCIDGPRERGR
jgi:hypothetical protein